MFLVENDLIVQNIPRCASHTTEHSIVMSDLQYKYVLPIKKNSSDSRSLDYSRIENSNDKNKEEFYIKLGNAHRSPKHVHVRLNEMYMHFGRKESAGIIRDYFDKFMSSLRYFYNIVNNEDVTLIRNSDDVDNKFIMDIFNTEFFNISEHRMDETSVLMEKLVHKNSIEFVNKFNFPIVFNSINWWNSGNKLTHEFDISDLNGFKEFIENRFDKEMSIKSKNIHPHIKFPSLIINDELKGHVWKTVEKKYHV